MTHSTAYKTHSSLNLKQCFSITDYHDRLPNADAWDWRTATRQEVLIGLGRGGELRLRYPNGATSRVQRLKGCSDDLKKLAALTITELIPPGIFADALEEELPQHREAADILRRWWAVKQEQP